jgi:penicillin amidase
LGRWLRRGIALFLVAALLATGLGWYTLRRSLPQLDGEAAVAGFGAAATVERDALGMATVTAASRADAYRALGYVHAQERYFAMDLMRRVAAGELAALFGAAALDADRRVRMHRFGHRAAVALANLDGAQRALLADYVAGVNAGLAALRAPPFEYTVLRQAPRPWTAEDSVLVVYAMFLDLNGGGTNARELALGQMHDALPPSVYAFLTPAGSSWDAPLQGAAFESPPIPPAADIDLRNLPADRFGKAVTHAGDLGIGSNNFAVGGALTANGAALVANDMHLSLRVPNIWFRARLRFTLDDGPVDIAGVTLPGVPGIVAGSNGHVAWAFTNSYGDWLDWVEVHWLDANRTRYRTATGDARATLARETIEVKGAASVSLDVVETQWGPVIVNEGEQTGLALAWTAHREGAVDLDLGRLETARSVEDALAIAADAGVPPQNFVVGDRAGHIAWTVIGAMPGRSGHDPQRPADWSVPGTGWNGWLEPQARPRLVDPPDSRLWTANARVAGGDDLALIGNGGYALGARSQQIRDGLRARARFAPADLLAVQLDDRSLFLERWWRLLRKTLGANPPTDLAELATLTLAWDAHASTDANAYRLVRAFRLYVHERVLDGLAAPMRATDPDFRLPAIEQGEGIVWSLLEQRPQHLLPPRYADWNALLLEAAARVVQDLGSQPGGLAARTWGEKNTSAIRHPMSRALPGLLGAWLDMPARELPGDSAMPRVQAPGFGASERFVVAPGHEDEGIFHMPGGQSGHPLSPFYGAGHEDWEQGRATPFLPGATVNRLTLSPVEG